MDIAVKTLAGEDAGTLGLSDEVFALEPRADSHADTQLAQSAG